MDDAEKQYEALFRRDYQSATGFVDSWGEGLAIKVEISLLRVRGHMQYDIVRGAWLFYPVRPGPSREQNEDVAVAIMDVLRSVRHGTALNEEDIVEIMRQSMRPGGPRGPLQQKMYPLEVETTDENAGDANA